MSTVPPLELKPGDEGAPSYAEVLARWMRDGRGEFAENLGAGWQYRALYADTAQTLPTFLLVVSAVDRRSPDEVEGFGGFARAMATVQSSLPGGRRALPKEPV